MKKLTSIYILTLVLVLFGCTKDSTNTNKNDASGKAGSLAQMITIDHYLYVINQSDLMIYDVENPLQPVYQNTVNVGFGIETIFPFGNHLFIGSTTGLYIYDITNPTSPSLATEAPVEHFTACDPVVANDEYAYVTLNSLRQQCGNSIQNNVLLTYDISDIENTVEVNSLSMTGPKGLALSQTHLYVCDENEGVIVFDISETPEAPMPIDTLAGFTANDIILDNSLMMVVCEDGLRQFDISNPTDIVPLSFMSTND